jgi:hypothetical protein
MRFNSEVQIHKESYILVEGLTKSRVSLNHFLTQVVSKTDLERLTITKMGNTNFSRVLESRETDEVEGYPAIN